MPKALSLKGCFPPIPTPFDTKGRVDHHQLANNLEKWQRTDLAGFVVLGSNGEAALLKRNEKIAVWKTAGQTISKGKLFIAGTGCESTAETLDLTEKAAALGARAAMVVTPHYYRARMDHAALMNHYTMVAERSPIPIILYNVPASTNVDISAELVVALSKHPNIIGMKESSGNVAKMGLIVREAPSHFQVLAGSGSFLLPALSVGAVGGVMALSAVAPNAVVEIIALFEAGKLKDAKKTQLRLIPTNNAVTSRFGIAGFKAALDLLGMYGGPVRSPLLPLDEPGRAEVAAILAETGLL
jgi:4-hydroxy-2-oxoglutarate aldolase